MLKVTDTEGYIRALTDAPLAGRASVLAFYEHRIGVICKDPKLMLMPLDDHMAHRGDGVFETMKYVGGRIYQLEPHIKRMGKSSSAIYLEPPCSWDEIGEIVKQVARAGGKDQGLVRLLLGRGPGSFGIDPDECPIASLYVVAYDLHMKPEEVFEKGVTAFKTSIPAKQPYLATIKTVNYLPNMLMKREAVQKGFDYPLCFNERGYLAEGATENVVIVDQGGVLHIPEMTNALAGTTLMRAAELIRSEVETTFSAIREDDLLTAKEAIIIGTTMDAVSVVRYNGKPIHDVRPGPVSKRIRELLKKDLAENGTPF